MDLACSHKSISRRRWYAAGNHARLQSSTQAAGLCDGQQKRRSFKDGLSILILILDTLSLTKTLVYILVAITSNVKISILLRKIFFFY